MVMLNFIDYSKSEPVQRALSNLCTRLERLDIEARWFGRVEQAPQDTVLLLHDPVAENLIPAGCRVLGQRTLNRRQRLILAERCGLQVPRWCSLNSQDEIDSLFDRWGVEHILYKADWSYSRGGIKLLKRGKWTRFNKFNPGADVFMQVLDGSPHTFKVDIFFDQVIACRKLLTRSVSDPKFYRSFTGVSLPGEIPPVEDALKALGRAVFDYSVGLTNVDIMFDSGGRPWVIELNTCSVGREATWRRWPDVYIAGYAQGVRRWVDAGCPAQYGVGAEALRGLAAQAGGLHAGEAA